MYPSIAIQLNIVVKYMDVHALIERGLRVDESV
jgi:hypothetical protein